MSVESALGFIDESTETTTDVAVAEVKIMKRFSVTLVAGETKLVVLAQRKAVGAEVVVITIDAEGENAVVG